MLLLHRVFGYLFELVASAKFTTPWMFLFEVACFEDTLIENLTMYEDVESAGVRHQLLQ